ncbi:MAG: type II secretion system F family protein [Aeoliella sp.]
MQIEISKTFSAAAISESFTPSRPRSRKGRVSAQDLANLTAQMAIMVRSGVDVASALHSLAKQCRRPALASVLQETHDAVIGGRSFSDALRMFPEVFDEAYVATVASGEATGSMADVLDQLAELERSQLRLSRTLRSLLIYPVLLICVSTAVIGVLLVFVLPKFAQLFADYDMSLPWITQALIAVAEELRVRWWAWGTAALSVIAGLVALPTTSVGRGLWDRFLLHAPLLRDVSRTLLVGRACRLIGMMMESGVTLLDSIRLARTATKNSLYKQMFAEIEEAVVNGRTFASALTNSAIVPPSATEMLATAEQTGKLAEVARLIGVYFEEEGEARTRQVVTVLEPMITVVMGTVVAVVVLAVMLPVFDLSSFAGKG